MIDFDFIEQKLNDFFSDGVFIIEVVQKKAIDNPDVSGNRNLLNEKAYDESSDNAFTTK